MGINAGIKVIRRITDEHRWKEFLQAVVEYFKDDARVCMEVKLKLDAPTESSSDTLLKLFHLTEAFNFVPGDDSLLGFWYTEFQSQNRRLYGKIGIVDKAELKEATTAKVHSETIRLGYTDVDLEQLISRSYLQPEQAIVFHVGEEPELPMYAHHFKAIESKLTCGGHMADIVLCGVSKLLEKFFPNHTKYWSEFEEEKGFPDGDRVSYESREQTDQFYRTLIESVNKKDEVSVQTKNS